ncbi:UNVERIFIED_CONTAM: hypothetical protein GTU68_060389 [Idotea baltica]|nr:hypothetical protein [Idotea baltica]
MISLTRADWTSRAEHLDIETRAFIQGSYCFAIKERTFDCLSPIDNRLLGAIARCDELDADKAVISARVAFEQGVWAKMAPAKRKEIMLSFAEQIKVHAEELALLETLDMGKPITDALTVDIPGSVRAIQWCAEAIDKLYDQIAPTSHDEIGMITREPIGVVAAIVPWNFPLLMSCWKLGPALASGNSVILKPSERSPLTALRLAQLALDAGIPSGVLNVLPGFGSEVGKALALHNDVDVVVFTGSTLTAKKLMVYSGESNMKRVWLEAGGKSPNIIFADAPDLDVAAQAAASTIAFNQGEVCTAGSRLLVEDSIKEVFLEKLIKALNLWVPKNPLDPEAKMGAIVDKEHLDKILTYVDEGLQSGAKLRFGSHKVDCDKGFYLGTIVFDCVDQSMSIAQEEIFGPVLSVITFSTTDEAIHIANNTPYGLAAGIWTANLSKAHKTAKAIKAGSIWINHYDGGDMTAPFGGFKQSGNGRDKSLHAFDKYTELKSTWIRL